MPVAMYQNPACEMTLLPYTQFVSTAPFNARDKISNRKQIHPAGRELLKRLAAVRPPLSPQGSSY